MMQKTYSQRAYMRHPSDIPIEIAAEPAAPPAGRRLKDVGSGGLACESVLPLTVGTLVSVKIPVVHPPFETRGRVVWCRGRDSHFDVGIQFMTNEDAFTARMVEQICHIEHYRNEVRQTDGRDLDAEEAAREWVSKYAADFPELPAG